jgi:hypothetical protein
MIRATRAHVNSLQFRKPFHFESDRKGLELSKSYLDKDLRIFENRVL